MSDDHPTHSELQRQIDEGREATKELRISVGELTRVVQKLEVTLAALSERIAVNGACPKPGACLDLDDDLARLREEHSAKIERIEEMLLKMKEVLDERRGERTMLGLICTAVGSIVGALVSAWMGRGQ